MKNKELADLFYKVAHILELEGVAWKPQAYRRAARMLEVLEEDISVIHRRGGKEALDALLGVGKGIADHIIEYLETGKVQKFDKLLKKVPKGAKELLQIEGIGPKKIAFLMEKRGIRSVEALKEAARQHKLCHLPSFGEKTEENILRAIEYYEKGQKRMPWQEAILFAEEIVSYLRGKSGVLSVEYAGSLRRRKETVGDIDILVASTEPEKVVEFFVTMPGVSRVLVKGPTKSSIRFREQIQVDLRVVPPESYATALQYFTGSKDHNIKLRTRALQKGHKLSEYGLFQRGTGERIPCRTEEELYRALELDYITPMQRKGEDEIEKAKR